MRNILQDKKGAFELNQLQEVVMILVVTGIILALGSVVLSEFMQETDDDQASSNINDTIEAIGDISGWLSLIVLVIVIGIILAIVFRVLPGARGGGIGAGALPTDY